MKKANRILAIALGLVALYQIPSATAQDPNLHKTGAALILTNGMIHTNDRSAEAVAIDQNGIILEVGDDAEVRQFQAGNTKIHDLDGKTVLPGLHDMHLHALRTGLQASECKFPQGSSLREIQQAVAQCVENAEPGEWITGGKWDASSLGGVPRREMLDTVAPENPVILMDTSAHSDWVNSLALKEAGITRDTPNPEGGVVEKDAAGHPTGILRENAQSLVRDLSPAPNLKARMKALEWSLDTLLANGITSFVSAAVDRSEAETFAALADMGKLKQRVRLCLGDRRFDQTVESLIADRNFYARDRLSTDCAKIYLDGVPTDSHTAAMLEPYVDAHGHGEGESSKGFFLVPEEELKSAVTRFDARGLTVKIHVAGDGAARRGLDAISAARKRNGFSGRLHTLAHASFVSEADITRARPMGITFEVSPYFWAPSPITDNIVKAVGPERMERAWPVRDMLNSGALVVPGSDWPNVPSVNPWTGIEMLVTRETLGGGESGAKGQRISIGEALAMYTSNAARQMGHEDKVGSIKRGMIADLIVVNQDPYKISPYKLHQTVVEMTIIDGEVVYELN